MVEHPRALAEYASVNAGVHHPAVHGSAACWSGDVRWQADVRMHSTASAVRPTPCQHAAHLGPIMTLPCLIRADLLVYQQYKVLLGANA